MILCVWEGEERNYKNPLVMPRSFPALIFSRLISAYLSLTYSISVPLLLFPLSYIPFPFCEH